MATSTPLLVYLGASREAAPIPWFCPTPAVAVTVGRLQNPVGRRSPCLVKRLCLLLDSIEVERSLVSWPSLVFVFASGIVPVAARVCSWTIVHFDQIPFGAAVTLNPVTMAVLRICFLTLDPFFVTAASGRC
jgi:hypothetical protein